MLDIILLALGLGLFALLYQLRGGLKAVALTTQKLARAVKAAFDPTGYLNPAVLFG